jgi:GntR family transcriptional regulator / MocR family aminotransferase
MAKLTTPFELVLPPNRSRLPIYRWLYSSLRTKILEGQMRPGTRLPSTRDLAEQYQVARGTIVNAFEQLKSEGYVGGSVGSGTFVSTVLPDKLLQAEPDDAKNIAAAAKRRIAMSDYAQRAQPFLGYDNRPTRAFRANLPALDLFPLSVWAKITAACFRRMSRRDLLGCDALGHLPLRQAIAEYLGRSRGVRCAAEQVVIVSGVQEALDMAARLLLNPGDQACIENPCYPGALQAFQAVRARIVTAGIDDQGIRINDLPRNRARLIYVTPGHQFPLGTTMSLARRAQLLAWARKTRAMIFEDDYDSEYRYVGRPIPALQGLDPSGLVLYAGSFSKVLFPGLRLGYLVAPANLLPYLQAMKSLTSRHAPMLEQLVLSEFITAGHFGRHLRRMRQTYAERLSVLFEEAQRHLAGLLTISNIEAGLQTVGWLCNGIEGEASAAAAWQRQVDVTPLSRYGRHKSVPEGLQLGFAAVDAKEIRRGVRELATVLEAERSKPRF